MLDPHLSKGWTSCSFSLQEPQSPWVLDEADPRCFYFWVFTQIWGQIQEEESGGRAEARGSVEAWSMGCILGLYTESGRPATGQQKEKAHLWSVCLGVLLFLLNQESNFRGLPSNKSWDLSFSIWKNKLAFLNPPSLSWKSSYPQNYKPLSCQKWASYAQHTFVVHSFFCARDFLWLLFLWLCLCMMQVRCKTRRWMRCL